MTRGRGGLGVDTFNPKYSASCRLPMTEVENPRWCRRYSCVHVNLRNLTAQGSLTGKKNRLKHQRQNSAEISPAKRPWKSHQQSLKECICNFKTDRQRDRQTETREGERETETERQRETETDRETERDRQRDRRTDGWTDRQAGRERQREKRRR